MNQPKPSLKTTIKLFIKFRSKIKDYYHKNWETNLMAIEPTEDGVAKFEIDEIEVI